MSVSASAALLALAVGVAACGGRTGPTGKTGTAGTGTGAAGTGTAGTGAAGTGAAGTGAAGTGALDAGAADVALDVDTAPNNCAPQVTTPPPGTFSFLSAGNGGTCGLRPDGALECWGEFFSTPPVSGGNYKDVYKGTAICAVRTTGELVCWGRGSPPAGVYEQVVVNDDGLCARRADQTVSCWSSPGSLRYAPSYEFETLTGGASIMCGLVASTHQIVCWAPDFIGGFPQAPDGPFVAVDTGRFFACGLRTDGNIVCWEPSLFASSKPPELHAAPPGGFHGLTVGEFHACALREDGQAICWGQDNQQDTVPPAGVAFKSLSAGTYHTCGILLDGTVKCWGGALSCGG